MANIGCTLCKIRDIYHDIVELENQINQKYGLSLNEAMLLCCLSDKEQMTSTEISEAMGLSCSNTSKVIKSVEDKKLIRRSMSKEDRRSMLFKLSPKGETKLSEMNICTSQMPKTLQKLLETTSE